MCWCVSSSNPLVLCHSDHTSHHLPSGSALSKPYSPVESPCYLSPATGPSLLGKGSSGHITLDSSPRGTSSSEWTWDLRIWRYPVSASLFLISFELKLFLPSLEGRHEEPPWEAVAALFVSVASWTANYPTCCRAWRTSDGWHFGPWCVSTRLHPIHLAGLPKGSQGVTWAYVMGNVTWVTSAQVPTKVHGS
ncbi:hypothetical protein AVEN_41288-1 [Araneus ventricosus]|uniref:Uncharacterized protein n=1 Tax=Araneus ventricosus TaxID=182803 RepID=A0A4Y2M9H9_ARAVE|nr:hypothetical protein AVEN_41288-1 [Araneus ventricosus]